MESKNQTVLGLFNEMVEAYPDRVCLKVGDISLTYRELYERALQLASLLEAEGLRHGSAVVLLLNRDCRLVESMLAVMMAGGFYVPLDIQQPKGRLNGILSQISPSFILGESCPVDYTGRFIGTEEHQRVVSTRSFVTVNAHLTGDDLVYVLFTSGTTGQPKGVAVSHKSVVNLLEAWEKMAPSGEALRGTCVCPYVFDVSVHEIFSIICYGGTLYLLEQDEALHVESFAAFLKHEAITSCYFHPGMLDELGKSLLEDQSGVVIKRILAGVEPITRGVFNKFLALESAPVVINAYGPTEATVFATAYRVTQSPMVNDRTPIGSAIDGNYLRILDEELQEVEQGSSGELFIGGVGLAVGYWDDISLTNERFIVDPYRKKERLYRTGDRVKMLPDGNLIYEGRIDYQIKLRGYRIEPGEIEQSAINSGFVTECCVGKVTLNGQDHLVMWLVFDDQLTQDESERVKGFLVNTLPSYMIPSYFVNLNRLPRTENGKVDRRLLPLPGMVSQSEFREPKPGAESQVCGIVANLLSLDRVSPSDNFFDLGGNSLTIARFLIRVKQLTGKELSVSSVFEAPVLADIAAELETCSAAVEKKGIVYSFCPRDRVYYPMTPVEKDLFLLQKLDPTGKQHYIVLQLSILSNKEEHFIRDVLNEIFKRHEAFRSAFLIVDDTPVQELLKEPKSSVLFKDIADLNPLEQKKTIQALLNRLGNISFDLATGYTFEMVLLRLSNERFLLLMSLNHLIFDGWSMGVFMNEFRRIYREKLSLTGQVVFQDGYQMVDVGFSLSQIPLDYYNDSLKFWSDYLGKGERVMVLPYREGADRKAAGRKGKRLWWRFDKQTSWGLQQLARREKTTLFSLFLAGYSLMLKHYSNDHDIVIGTPIAGRDDDALTQVIGYLTNMVPVRLVIGEDQNFQNYLLKVTQNVVAALSHGDIAFGKLLKHLDVVTRPGLSPLFQVIMVMQNWPEQNISLDEPILKQKEVGNNTVRADLTFNVELVDDEIECWLEYDTELFEDSMAGRMQSFLQKLYEVILSNPQRRIVDILAATKPYRRDTVVIGEGPKLRKILYQLQKNDFNVVAVVSKERFNDLIAPVYDSISMLPGEAKLIFDYLFVIRPKEPIPVELYSRVRLEAIMLHYGVFPGMVGDTAFVEALLRKEKYFGVIWQRLSTEFFGGDILFQHKFPIKDSVSPSDLLRLCRKAAENSFELLLTDLMNDTLRQVKVSGGLVIDSSISLASKVVSWIDFNAKSKELATLIMALQPIPGESNLYGMPFFVVRGVAYYITGLTIVSSAPAEEYGRFVSIGSGKWGISTLDGVVQPTLVGRITIDHIASLNPSGGVDRINIASLNEITSLRTSIAPQEAEWRKILSNLEFTEAPIYSEHLSLIRQKINLGVDKCWLRASLLLFHLVRLGGGDRLAIGRIRLKSEDEATIPFKILSDWLPIDYKIDDSLSVWHFSEELYQIYQGASVQRTWFNDLPFRDQDLSHLRGTSPNIYIGERFISDAEPSAMVILVTDDSVDMLLPGEEEYKIFGLRCAEIIDRQIRLLEVDSDLPLKTLPLLTEREEMILLERREEAFSINDPLLKSIIGRGLFNGNKIAVNDGGTLYSYDQLFKDVVVLKGQLEYHGVNENSRVALWMPAGYSMIKSILACWGCKASFMPIDPDYPVERLQWMIDQAKPVVMVTDRAVMPSGLEVNFIHPDKFHDLGNDDLGTALSQESDTNWRQLARQMVEETLNQVGDREAYLIFTSGSTGTPNGVRVGQRAITRFVNEAVIRYGFNAEDIVLQFSNPTFDAALEEICCSLFVGATLVIRPPATPEPNALMRFVVVNRITVLDLPTAFWRLWVNSSYFQTENIPSSIRLVILGGEALFASDLQLWRNVVSPTVSLVNSYGPTETAVVVLTTKLDKEIKPYSVIPLGDELPATQAWIMNSKGEALPPLVPGELWITGEQLALGYLNQPEKDRAAFPELIGLYSLDALTLRKNVLSNPSGDADLSRKGDGESEIEVKISKRAYRTGDKVVRTYDGRLLFLGRMDHQLKIRGFRVDPLEVSRTMQQYRGVDQAVAGAITQGAFGKVLAAWYVSDRDGVDVDNLKVWLQQKLPPYMVPALLLKVEGIPLTVNGKTDFSRLPIRRSVDELNTNSPVLTKTESWLSSIWREVLDVPVVRPSDDFFGLGGHSILVAHLIGKLWEEKKIKLPVAVVFDSSRLDKMALWIEKNNLIVTEGDSLEGIPEGELIELTRAQQRPWLLTKMGVEQQIYNLPLAYRITGGLNRAALEKAFDALIRKHPALRTRFVEVDGKPYQVVDNKVSFAINSDLGGLDAAFNPRNLEDVSVESLIEKFNRIPFDLSKSPLFRVLLFGEKSDYLLVIVFHHIVVDGWSVGVFYHDLIWFYKAYLRSTSVEVIPDGLGLAAFAKYQIKQEENGFFESSVTRLLGVLSGAPVLSSLKGESERPKVMGMEGKTLQIDVPATLTGTLHQAAQIRKKSVFSLLLASFSAWFRMRTRQQDFVLGVMRSGRELPMFQDSIGYFSEVMPMRFTLEELPSFNEWLEDVHGQLKQYLSEPTVPYELLLQRINPERSLSWNPVFQILLVHQQVPESHLNLEGLEVRQVPAHYIGSKVDLTVYVLEDGERFWLSAEYSDVLFEEHYIQEAIVEWLDFLTASLMYPKKLLPQLPVAEHVLRRAVGLSWSDLIEPEWHSLSRQFKTMASLYPDTIAIQDTEFAMTYSELDNQTDNLAKQILGRIKVGSRVGLQIPQSLDAVIAMLSVVKAGCCFVSIGLDYPTERVRYMLADAGVDLLISSHKDLAIHDVMQARLEDLRREAVPIRSLPDDNPNGEAYIIYTSGTTGKPKGVLVSVDNLSGFINQAIRRYQLGHGERVMQFASPTFDASQEEIWTSLLSGSTLFIRNDELISTPARFINACQRYRISVLDLPTAYFHLLITGMEEAGIRPPNMLRLVILGGEAVQSALVKKWFNAFGEEIEIINTYGPTETTIVATWATLNKQDETFSIGRPVPGNSVFVVDEWLRPVLPGVKGELLIGGSGVSRGYIGNEELNKRKFVSPEFLPVGRYYRTGDLVRFDKTGNLHFLGRQDEQVKIRGFRVEPGEVEAVLQNIRGIQGATVGSRADRLIAWITPSSAPTEEIIRKKLQAELPDYMVPQAFILMDSFPLTPSGKVDKKSLPDPMERNNLEGYNESLYSDSVKTKVVDLWRKTIGHAPESGQQNFFSAGGHSLLAVQLITKIEQSLKTEVSLKDFFGAPTVDGLVALCKKEMKKEFTQSEKIVPTEQLDRLKLSSSQIRIWFLEKTEEVGTAFNIPLAFTVQGDFNLEVFEKSLNQLIARHEILRMHTLSDEGGNPMLTVVSDFWYSPQFDDIRTLNETEQTQFIQVAKEKMLNHRFNIDEIPLFKFHLIKRSDDNTLLLMNFHHLIADNRSIGLYIRLLSKTYNLLLESPDALIPWPELQYGDYIAWEQRFLQGDQFKSELSWWLEQLKGASVILGLSYDFPRTSRQTYTGGTLTLHLGGLASKGVRTQCANLGVTPNMLLLSVFALLIKKYSSQDDFIIGVPVAGRVAEGSEEIPGVMINNLPLRFALEDELDVRGLINRTKDILVDALDHQSVPFDKIISGLKMKPDPSVAPLFQVMFNMLNAHDESLSFHGCLTQYVPVQGNSSKYDLTLTIRESGQSYWLDFEYSTALFLPDTIRQMAFAYQFLAEQICLGDTEKAMQLPMLRESDPLHPRQSGIQRSDYPLVTLPYLFRKSVKEHPERIAVESEGIMITYAELGSLVDKLSLKLVKQGVQPGDYVGVFMPRDHRLPASLLAVQFAGAAYIPLDPVYPAERIAMILEDASAKLVITLDHLAELLPAGTPILTVDEWPEEQGEAEDLSSIDKLAYIIFTSGSTGRPKGVGILQQSFVNFLWSMKENPGMTTRDKLLAVTTVSFDIAGLELFLPLICGASLYFVGTSEQHDAVRLMELISQRRISFMQATPTTWKMLMTAGWSGNKNLKVLCGGEALTRDLANEVSKRVQAMYNVYGPTETTVWSSIAKVTETAENTGVVPLGEPVANNYLYITDAYLNPLPAGVPGELLIGGDGVSIGYIGRDDLTKERFLPDPFAGGNTRLYKTGDLVRRTVRGEIEYLGRTDFQIKIRGFRIEPGEIEEVLAMHPTVEHAVVILRNDIGGTPRLVAYYTLKRGHDDPGRLVLKGFLTSRLPDYMVPSVFMMLQDIPLTLNGKVDRKALPLPELSTMPKEKDTILPASATEQVIFGIWSELLGYDSFGVTDDFFDLGGHSLLAVSLMTKIEHKLKVRLPLAIFFDLPTIRGLAEKIDQGGTDVFWRALVPIRTTGNRPPLFLIHGAGLNILLYNSLVDHMPADQPVYGIQAKGLDGKEEPLTTIEDIAAFYITEMKTVQPEGPFALAGFSLGGLIAFEVARQLKAEGIPVLFLGMFDTVAYSSELMLSKTQRMINKYVLLYHKVFFNIRLLFSDLFKGEFSMFKTKWRNFAKIYQIYKVSKSKRRDFEEGDRDKLPEYALRVHAANLRAGNIYVLKPSDVQVCLFRAERQGFYIEEAKTYGWSEFALGGVDVINVPGEHSTLFKAPNDKAFALLLYDKLTRSFEAAKQSINDASSQS